MPDVHCKYSSVARLRTKGGVGEVADSLTLMQRENIIALAQTGQTFQHLFNKFGVVALLQDDAEFQDGKLSAGLMAVPMSSEGDQWLALPPLLQKVPSLFMDLEEIPIAMKLFEAVRDGAIKKNKTDPLATCWIHMQAQQHMVSSLLEHGMQAFSSKFTPMNLVGRSGEYYCQLDNGHIAVASEDGGLKEHVHYETLLKNNVCAKCNDQESSLFALYLHECLSGDRIIYFPDQCHIESRDVTQSSKLAGLRLHTEQINYIMGAREGH